MTESYLEGCEIAARKDQDGPMFEFSDAGMKNIKAVRLRGYAIIPVEEYHRLQRSPSDTIPEDGDAPQN